MNLDFANLSLALELVYTSRIALRPVTLSDSWPLYQATRHPRFNRHLLWPQPQDDWQMRQRIGQIVDSAAKGRMAAVSAVLKDTGEWISLFRFQPYEGGEDTMEMGIWTHHRFWHGQYSLELGRLCIDAAFISCPELQRLMGASAPANRSSCRLMEQCGMSPGELVLRKTEGPEPLELREYSTTRAQWQDAYAHKTAFRRFDAQDHNTFQAVTALGAETQTSDMPGDYLSTGSEAQFA
jgi:RimJ/RimL family protein N-acetyltransferase